MPRQIRTTWIHGVNTVKIGNLGNGASVARRGGVTCSADVVLRLPMTRRSESVQPRARNTGARKRRPRLPHAALQNQKMEAVGQLAGGIAHDLSNLMSAMFGWLEIAASQLPPDHSARESLKMVDRAARQAVGLTRSLLTFANQTPSEKATINLNDTVREALYLLGRLLPARIEQRSVIPSDPIWVHADATQIQQVVMNLALNAQAAMPQGGVIEVDLGTAPPERLPGTDRPHHLPLGAATLRVRDTGCGIPDELKSRIFEPFYTTRDRARGTGLGLAIVHAIVNDHHGWIDLESQVDQGSTFTVYLPRAERPATTSTDTHPERLNAPGDAGVLVVEDNSLVRAMLTTVLVDAGYRVFEAADGPQGLAVFRSSCSDIDVLVVDLDLPGINGVEALDTMLDLQPETAGIAISGYPLSESVKAHLSGLGCSVLNKPFQVPDLKRMIASVLQGQRRE